MPSISYGGVWVNLSGLLITRVNFGIEKSDRSLFLSPMIASDFEAEQVLINQLKYYRKHLLINQSIIKQIQ